MDDDLARLRKVLVKLEKATAFEALPLAREVAVLTASCLDKVSARIRKLETTLHEMKPL